ncbi:acetyltransferase [Pseudovirgaria hyperparasitica]|uniref:Acetyltransferase n=1 Tax=Pseudovirgaria hyperparasitica TaxID=470096 RepID=A0A6A6W8Q2_9PEZI|nr:acetyltransferase [Pseudovirgaria hyperparasitica]KAF2758589.1 acetyltransferase [Pseudovirgaria hyperparasitica]
MLATTPRLSLREFTANDVDSFYALESNPANARYQTWEPRTRQQSSKLVDEAINSILIQPRRVIELVVETGCETETPRFIGRVGCMIADNIANLWFSFLPAAQGKGYATEAVRALITFLHDAPAGNLVAFETLQIECDPRNTGSRRIAERLGFQKISEELNVYKCKGELVGSVVYETGIQGWLK